MSHAPSHDPAARAKLYELVEKVAVCMMTTVDEADGSLRSRPMRVVTEKELDPLWFFTTAKGGKVAEIGRDGHVNLGFSDPSGQNYVSITGRAVVVNDRAKAADLWSEGMRVWFPKGTDDPDLALIRVDPLRGEYWDSPNSTLLHAYGYVKAVATGERPKGGENEKVALAG